MWGTSDLIYQPRVADREMLNSLVHVDNDSIAHSSLLRSGPSAGIVSAQSDTSYAHVRPGTDST